MGSTFGRQVLQQFGGSIQVTADGKPEMKAGGVTIDWSTITALAADTTFNDGVFVFAGEKVLRYGQVVTQMGLAEVETVTFTGGPTAGSAILTLPADAVNPAQSTGPLAFNASAAAVQAALEGLSRIGVGNVTVTVAGAGSAGSPYVYTITYATAKTNLPQLTATNTFAGGTTPTVTIATTTDQNASGGMYGPYDPSATDGRQTLARGVVWIVNETVREGDHASNHPPVLNGGRVFKNRIIATNGSASLAAGPTFANLETYCPRLQYVIE